MLLTADTADILSVVRAQFHDTPPERLGIAVSGGGDSMALLHILAHSFGPGQVELHAATVDHGLRPEAADEAALAGGLAKQLGIDHSVLKWDRRVSGGNLQDRAREARYRLLADWAKSRKISVLALAHTADDQAETVLMRLARSAGVTGLAAMPARRTMHGVTLFRPLLDVTRADLRSYLRQRNIDWAEDPSNADPKFDRIKARQALELLEPLGVTADALSGVARNMTQAREALDWYTFLAARDLATVDGGNVVLDLQSFRALPGEIARRLVLRSVSWINGSHYPPRSQTMTQALTALRQGKPTTLAGCQALRQGPQIWIFREYNAVRKTRCLPEQPWDGRWKVSGRESADCEVRALGRHGLMFCDNWRETGRPHASLLASPAVWSGDDLVAAPLAGMPNGWSAELADGAEAFYASILTH